MPTKKQLKLLTTFLAFILTLCYGVTTHTITPSLFLGYIPNFVAQTHASSSYPVLRVVDGDTIDILKGGEKVRIRLIGINAPESVDPRRPVECFGKEASRYADTLLRGKEVSIETDPSQGNIDKYGRTLAYVYLLDGRSLNLQMIREGYVYEYTYHVPYKYQDEYKIAERDARVHERGLWSPSTCAGKKAS
jgi:micrococcal nuclease